VIEPAKSRGGDEVTDEQLLVAGVVRTLAEYAFPFDPLLVDRAVADAVQASLSGASITEACRVGQLFIAQHQPDEALTPDACRVGGPLADRVA
jgi:hypothetical protein